jgi:hypothetical protein
MHPSLAFDGLRLHLGAPAAALVTAGLFKYLTGEPPKFEE